MINILVASTVILGLALSGALDTHTVDKITQQKIEENQGLYYGGPFIVDLDFCTDVDDACAVRMATSLDDRGVIDLKAVMLSTTGQDIVPALQGILNYDGYATLPIGTSALDIQETSPYWEVCSMFSDLDTLQVYDSVSLYRKVLAESELPVTVVTTGYTSNIMELLKSGPDKYSNKNGVDLVKEKVGTLYITGGSFPEGYDNNFWFCTEARQGVDYILNYCEAPVCFVINTNGAPFTCGGILQRTNGYENDPVKLSLDTWGCIDGRAAWDPMSVWLAAYPMEFTKTSVEKVNVTFDVKSGHNHFELDENGKYYMITRLNDNYIWYKTQLDSYMLR